MAKDNPHGVEEPSLSCPLWVKFLDQETGLPFFLNVRTYERAESDPDPEGERRLHEQCDPQPPQSQSFSSDQVLVQRQGEVGLISSLQDPPAAEIQPAIESEPWRSRPARVQKAQEPANAQYVEGSEEFNIYYGKYEKDRFNPKEREPSSTRCVPEEDAGWTHADLPGAQASYCCLFFARGCCSKGHDCTYYHHVPTDTECLECDVVHDIFGRERYARHRDDMGGVGSMNCVGQTLFVGDLRFDRTVADTTQRVEREVRESFGACGEVDRLRIIPSKAVGFVGFTTRGSAEFAKVVMDNQRLGKSACIRVKWASDDPNPRAVKHRRTELCKSVESAMDRRLAERGLSAVQRASVHLANLPTSFRSVTAPYPHDTAAGAEAGEAH